MQYKKNLLTANKLNNYNAFILPDSSKQLHLKETFPGREYRSKINYSFQGFPGSK